MLKENLFRRFKSVEAEVSKTDMDSASTSALSEEAQEADRGSPLGLSSRLKADALSSVGSSELDMSEGEVSSRFIHRKAYSLQAEFTTSFDFEQSFRHSDMDAGSEGEGSSLTHQSGLLGDLESPLPSLDMDLSEDELRETAFEVIVAAVLLNKGEEFESDISPSEEDQSKSRSPARAAVLKVVKDALVRRSKRRSRGSFWSSKKPSSQLEFVREQLEIPEKRGAGVRKALQRAIDSHKHNSQHSSDVLIVPLELLQHVSASDFSGSQEYRNWQKRQLKVLQIGLFTHPSLKHEALDDYFNDLKKAIVDINNRPVKAGKNKEAFQSLRTTARIIAGKACHWADGFPFNIHLYTMVLRCLFDNLEENNFVEHSDQVMHLIKKTWRILGIEQTLHHTCFAWVLFRQFIATGQTEVALLKAAEKEMKELDKFIKAKDPYLNRDFLLSTLTVFQRWAEMRLLCYRRYFCDGAHGVMERVVSISSLAARMLDDNQDKEEQELESTTYKIGVYIQSSMSSLFSQVVEHLHSEHSKGHEPFSSRLAEEIATLAKDEEEKYSPIWNQCHPCPAKVAAVTLHSCFKEEFKGFLLDLEELTTECIKALQSAATLERQLIKMATVEHPQNCGVYKQEIIPFAVDYDISGPLKQWLQERMEQLKEWVNRNVEQEEWKPNAIRERYALSAVEMLRMIEETSDLFFMLPISREPELLEVLMAGVNSILLHYVSLAMGVCENYSGGAASRDKPQSVLEKVSEVWRKKYDALILYRAKVWPQLANGIDLDQYDPLNVQQLCVRINTLYHVQNELEFLEKKVRYGWGDIAYGSAESVDHPQVRLEQARVACKEGIERLCEFTADKVVFSEMYDIIWEKLYTGNLAKQRIKPVIEYLEREMKTIADTVTDWLRDRVIKHLMRACFQRVLHVLDDRSCGRPYDSNEVEELKEDINLLKEHFKADGEGLPADVVDNMADPLLHFLKTQTDIPKEESNHGYSNSKSSNVETNIKILWGKNKSSPPVPPVFQHSNSLATAVGYKCHIMASKLVRKTYGLSSMTSKW